jgi:hypothetical protein
VIDPSDGSVALGVTVMVGAWLVGVTVTLMGTAVLC